MVKTAVTPNWQRALILLTSTVVGVVIIAALYFISVVFIPVALAIFLTFLLNMPVRALERWRFGRVPSVVVVVLLTMIFLGGLSWLITRQVSSLVHELPKYTANIKEKINSLKKMSAGSARLQQSWQEITEQLQGKPEPEARLQDKTVVEPPVVYHTRGWSNGMYWVERLPNFFSPAAEFLVGFAFTIFLTIFMLLKREDLRSRFIRLAGGDQLTVTTKAVDEAGDRISSYLVMQAVINTVYGVILGVALLLIGLNHALLWGLIAALLRYVPYIGAWITAGVLCLLSLALFNGWVQPLLVLGVIVTLELLTANLAEPWLYGHSIGVSEVALLVSAAFWAFLWGPIGLVLSGPLTVCLVVLGRYVPHLRFVDVLMGDEPAMDPKDTFYQRLLAKDQDESAQLARDQAKETSPGQVFDILLVPALNCLKRDRDHDELEEADELAMLQITRVIVDDVGERKAAVEADATESAKEKEEETTEPLVKIPVFACPAQDGADAVALEMLRQMLDPTVWDVEVVTLEKLYWEKVNLFGGDEPAVVCIGALPPGGLTHTRQLCKRLRARWPQAKILVGRWGLRGNLEQNQEQIRDAGADEVETTLVAAKEKLESWLPLLCRKNAISTAERGPQQTAGRGDLVIANK